MHNVDIFGNRRPPQSSHQGTDDIMIFTINDKNSDFMSMGSHEHYCGGCHTWKAPFQIYNFDNDNCDSDVSDDRKCSRQYIIELLLKGLHRLEYRGYDRFLSHE